MNAYATARFILALVTIFFGGGWVFVLYLDQCLVHLIAELNDTHLDTWI